MTRLWTRIAIVALLSSTACSKKLAGMLDSPSSTVRSSDKHVEITLPSGWREAELPGAVGKLQAKAILKDAYVSVISESKADLTHTSIDQYADMILGLEAKKKTLTEVTVTPPKKLKINGREAIQYELRGNIKNVKIIYLKTFIESDTRWTQVMAWTTPSHWDEVQEDFKAINETFKEVSKEAPASAVPAKGAPAKDAPPKAVNPG